MSRCKCGCGHKTADGLAYNSPSCRDKVERGLARARELARGSERPDPLADLLKLSPRQRKVLAVLRHGPATGDELAQEEVGGRRAAARVDDLRGRGFDIPPAEPIRQGLFRYTLRGEPRPAPAVAREPGKPEAGISTGGRGEPSPAPPRLHPVPEPSQPQCAIFDYDDEAA